MRIEITDEMAIELSDAYVEAYSEDSKDLRHLRDVVGALLVYIPDPRGAPVPRRVVEPVVERNVVRPKGKLTPHQREVYERIARLSRRRSDPWVADTHVGSKNACDRLVEKGWITMDISYGPRGGERRWYQPWLEVS